MIILFSYLLFELSACVAGTLYISKYRDELNSRYFVYFLWLTFGVEAIGTIPGLIYYYDMFPFLKETWFESNHWLQNVYLIINFSFYVWYFNLQYKTKTFKRISKIVITIYIVLSILNLVFSDVYFKSISSFTYIVGTMLVMIFGFIYLFEVLQSDKILIFYKMIPFYVVLGSIIFHLLSTPLFIYSKYYSMEKSPEFVDIRKIILNSAIFFMYTCYTIGFLVCYKKNNFYRRNRSYL